MNKCQLAFKINMNICTNLTITQIWVSFIFWLHWIHLLSLCSSYIQANVELSIYLISLKNIFISLPFHQEVPSFLDVYFLPQVYSISSSNSSLFIMQSNLVYIFSPNLHSQSHYTGDFTQGLLFFVNLKDNRKR